jgi:hypothetical protein
VSLATNSFVASIAGPQAPQGVVVSNQLGVVFTAGDNDGTIRAFSLQPPFAQQWAVFLTPNGADNVALDAATGLVYVAISDVASAIVPGTPTGALAVLDASGASSPGGAASGRGRWVANISYPGGGHPEEFQLSAASSLIYGSCPTCPCSCVVVSSRLTNAVVAQWPLPANLNTNNPFANSLDDANYRLFVAYQADATHTPFFVVHNTLDGSVVWAMQTTQKCDQIKRHPTAGLIFGICGGSAPPEGGSTI